MYRQESEVQANERRSSLLQVCGAEGSPSDASFEIKFINVKYMQMGSGALEMGLCSREMSACGNRTWKTKQKI